MVYFTAVLHGVTGAAADVAVNVCRVCLGHSAANVLQCRRCGPDTWGDASPHLRCAHQKLELSSLCPRVIQSLFASSLLMLPFLQLSSLCPRHVSSHRRSLFHSYLNRMFKGESKQILAIVQMICKLFSTTTLCLSCDLLRPTTGPLTLTQLL